MTTEVLFHGEYRVFHGLEVPKSLGAAALESAGFVQVRAMTEAIEWVTRPLPCLVTQDYTVWAPWWALVLYDSEFDMEPTSTGNEIVRCVTDVETRAIYLKQIIRENLRARGLGGSASARANIRLRNVPQMLQWIAGAYPNRLDACLRDPVAYEEAKQLMQEGMQAAQNLRDSQ